MLRCRDITELVTDYLEGKLSLGQRVLFQIHLGTCVHCRAYLSQMRQTVRTLGALATEPMPNDVREEMLRRFRGWIGKPPR